MGVKIYLSGISGNKEVKKKQQRVQMILDSKSITYEAIDITEPGKEKDKETMQQKAKVREALGKHPLPPQIFNEDEYCGDYEDFDMANEIDQLEAFLHLPLPSKFSSDDVTAADKLNGSREDSVQNGGKRTEMNGDVELSPINGDNELLESAPAPDDEEEDKVEDVENVDGHDTLQEQTTVDNAPDETPAAPDPDENQTEETARSEVDDEETADNEPEPEPEVSPEDIVDAAVTEVTIEETPPEEVIVDDGVRKSDNVSVPVVNTCVIESNLTESGPVEQTTADLSGVSGSQDQSDTADTLTLIENITESSSTPDEESVVFFEKDRETGGFEGLNKQEPESENPKPFDQSDSVLEREKNLQSLEIIIPEKIETERDIPQAKATVGKEAESISKFGEEEVLEIPVNAENPLYITQTSEKSSADELIKDNITDLLQEKQKIENIDSLSNVVRDSEPYTKSAASSLKEIERQQPTLTTGIAERNSRGEREFTEVGQDKVPEQSQETVSGATIEPHQNLLSEQIVTDKVDSVIVHSEFSDNTEPDSTRGKATEGSQITLRDTSLDSEKDNQREIFTKTRGLTEIGASDPACHPISKIEILSRLDSEVSGTPVASHRNTEQPEPPLFSAVDQDKDLLIKGKSSKEPISSTGTCTKPTRASCMEIEVIEGSTSTSKIARQIKPDDHGEEQDEVKPLQRRDTLKQIKRPSLPLIKSSSRQEIISTEPNTDESKMPSRIGGLSIKEPKVAECDIPVTDVPVSNVPVPVPDVPDQPTGIESAPVQPHSEGVPTREIMYNLYQPFNVDNVSFSPQLVAHYQKPEPVKAEERGVKLRNWDRRPSEIDVVKEVRFLLDERDTDLAICRARGRAGLPPLRNPHRRFIDQMNKLISDVEATEEVVEYQVVHPYPPPKQPTPPPVSPRDIFMAEVIKALNTPWPSKPTSPPAPENVFLQQVKELVNEKETGSDESEFGEKVRVILDKRESNLGIVCEPKGSDHSAFLGDMLLLMNDEPIIKDQEGPPTIEQCHMPQTQVELVKPQVRKELPVESKVEKKGRDIEIAQIFIRDNIFPVLTRVTSDTYKVFVSSLDSEKIELGVEDLEALTITVVEDNGYKSDVAKIVVVPKRC